MPLILTPFRFYNFRIWTAANGVSVTGTWMQVLAANWLLLAATGSAAQMGLGVLAHTGPAVLLAPWAGSLADRLPARRLLTVTQLLHALTAGVLGLVAVSGGAIVPAVYAMMVLGGVVAAIEGPSFGRFGSLMVDRSRLGAALGVGSLTNSAGRILGMSAGGVLIAAVGPGPLFLANAASFLLVVAAMYRLRPVAPGALAGAGGEPAAPAATEGSAPRQRDPAAAPEPAPAAAAAPDPAADGHAADGLPATTWAGIRYLARDPMVLITLGLAFLLGSLGRNYQVTMAAMTAGPLGGGPDAYGMLSTVFAVGTVAGGLAAGHAGRFRLSQLAIVGVAMSVLQAVSGLSPDLLWFAATLVPIAAAAVLVDTVVATRMQLDNPLALRGRVLGAVGATGAVAGAVGAPLLGLLSDLAGPRGALGVAGVVTVAGSALALAGYLATQRRRDAEPGTGPTAEPAATAPAAPVPAQPAAQEQAQEQAHEQAAPVPAAREQAAPEQAAPEPAAPEPAPEPAAPAGAGPDEPVPGVRIPVPRAA